ncbi:hypothetical protein [Acinetobacter genomosp. 15BJ]|uniref:Uncharacterized protein n=1 Tax=Acinetobacter genomosp. 15BJ TaxID=106651 RepID=R9B2K8_9GAMM|nr:hypothetical protein [Acinetobacter genomosp. 15BJ]EOR08719.1 hypothetical protein F896_01246 [Acinetobacter genomosp. 15BJ]MCH7292475.1 hypothetical protein [Acinetobacter genomosp. 15BJ]MDO3657802.1 hypothetical protein [Acinetobacter genomosp. 15BJ]
MSNVLFILGLIFLVGFPIYSHLFFYDKIQRFKDPRVFYCFTIIPGCILIGIAVYLSPAKTYIKTEACGIVKQYKMFPKKRSQIERLAIVMEQSGYIRYFDFDNTLPRVQVNDHICFELYDRFKNKGLNQSRIIKIITPP